MTNVPFRASAIVALDELLRGKLTDAKQVRLGMTPVRLFGPWALVLGAIYGSFIAWYAIAGGAANAWWHLLYVMVKLPALFLPGRCSASWATNANAGSKISPRSFER